MNREEILARARQENRDEMEIQVRERAMKWTYLVLVLTAAVFAYLRSLQGQSIMDLAVMVCASVAAGQLYRYLKTREKWCLGLGAAMLLAAAAALVRFCMGY